LPIVYDLSLIGDVRSHPGYKLKIVHPLLVGLSLAMPIGNFACSLIKGEVSEGEKGPDHVFSDSFCLSFGLSSDLAVDVETCVAPVEDFLDQGKADELFPEQQREDLVGEDLLDNLVMETTYPVKGAIRSCPSFGNQDMDVRMEVDTITESLDHGNYTRHKLTVCGCVEKR